MTARVATCRCGQLRAACTGEPVRVSVCHCLDCQKRSGSAFAAQARWPADRVALSGTAKEWSPRDGDGGRATFLFCPDCGGTLSYTIASMPGLVAIALGAFADPGFPPPAFSVFENRKHPWVAITGDGVQHD